MLVCGRKIKISSSLARDESGAVFVVFSDTLVPFIFRKKPEGGDNLTNEIRLFGTFHSYYGYWIKSNECMYQSRNSPYLES